MVFALKVRFYKFLMLLIKLTVKLMAAPKPILYCGPGSSTHLAKTLLHFGLSKTIIITDKDLHALGLLEVMKQSLTELGIKFVVYDGVEPDPTFNHVREGLSIAQTNNCDCVLGFGGGSPIDVAKMVALSITNNQEPEKFIGFFKAKKRALPLFVVPTTAGTGSEVTIGAVVSNATNHNKELVVDGKTIPLAVALDPQLMVGLPPHITAATGMDALTHAVEAYLSKIATNDSDGYGITAIRMIFANLKTAYENGENVEAREAMALGSFYAGLAFTQAGTGYVHSIAHQLGNFYHTPHGVGNAMVLPYILKFYGDKGYDRLAELALAIDLGTKDESKKQLAEKFIESVIQLNEDLNIPAKFDFVKEKHFSDIVKGALKETHYTYAVPKYMDAPQCREFLNHMCS